jgi:hypothetical protein
VTFRYLDRIYVIEKLSSSVTTVLLNMRNKMVCRVRVYVCMIIISPYLLRHWLRLDDDKRLYYPIPGVVWCV